MAYTVFIVSHQAIGLLRNSWAGIYSYLLYSIGLRVDKVWVFARIEAIFVLRVNHMVYMTLLSILRGEEVLRLKLGSVKASDC